MVLRIYWLICLIAFYISLVGFVAKAGYPFYFGLIPFLNLYCLLKSLHLSPILIAVLGIFMIFWEHRMFIFTLLLVFLPFLISYSYGHMWLGGILAFLCPIVVYPYFAFFNGNYQYESGV